MGALVICVTKGTEVKLALVELFPGTAFYGSQVLLADSDSGLILSTIGRLLGSRWMSDCPKHENSQHKTGLDWTSMTSMLKKTARTKHNASNFGSVRTHNISSSFSLSLS
jgi:hypothetical protein